MFAAFKAGLVPVNTNYRYAADEILYLFDNADAEAVVFHAAFTPLLEEVRDRLPKVKRWYVVADGEPGPRLGHAVRGRSSPAAADRFAPPWGRSGDDLLLLYTGGTTGMPKGVMWRQDDLFAVLGARRQPGARRARGRRRTRTSPTADRAGPGPAARRCPLMHGTGQFSAFVGLRRRRGHLHHARTGRFDPADLLRTRRPAHGRRR